MAVGYSSPVMGSQILHIVNVVLPVFLVAGVGALFSRFVIDRMVVTSLRRSSSGVAEPDAAAVDGISTVIRRSLHLLTFGVAGPALIFTKLLHAELGAVTVGEPVLVALAMYVLLTAISFGIGAVGRWNSEERRATVLALASKNCANYGLPIVLYAFGEEGLVIGTLFMIAHIVTHMTVGLSIAGWAGDGSRWKRLLGVFRFPYIYAVGLAFLLRAVGPAFDLPAAIARPIEMVGEMWIPLMLILLGMELARIRIAHVWQKASLLAAVKLVLPPLLALGLVTVLRIDGLVRDVLIVQSTMPTAVNGLLLARQFDVRPDLVASVLMLSTLGSIVTISVLLGILA
jgi:predicted permease